MGWGEAIAAIVSIASAANANKAAKGAVVPYGEAYRQASNEVSGNWDNTLEKTLQNLKNNQISRGVYGQLPSDVLTRATAADIESQKNANINSLTNAIMTNSQSRADALKQQASSALSSAVSGLASSLGNSNYSIDWSNLGKTKNKTANQDGSITSYDLRQ